MRRFTHFGRAATVAALAAGGIIALGGALPASAVAAVHPAAHVAVSVMTQAGSRATAVPDTAPGKYNISFTVTNGVSSCTEPAVLEFYFSSFGYWNIKITIGDNVCLVNGNPLQFEAAATCSGFNIWGSPAIASGDVTIASCNSSHPTFQQGGYRVNVNGTWVYHTELISPA